MDSRYILVLITAPSRAAGQQIAQMLLEKKLAACVNLLSPVQSMYTWQGEICTAEEALLIVKSRADLFREQLLPAVHAVHPYQVPEVIALPLLDGSQPYLDWIESVTLPAGG